MFGLDFRLTRLDLLLEHKRAIGLHIKYGQMQQCCLGVGSSSSQFGTFLILDDQYMVDIMKGNVEVEIMSKDKKALGLGRAASCELSEGVVPAGVSIIPAPTFQFIGGTNVQMQIIHKTKGKPDIILGSAQLSICMYQLLLRKGCNCDLPVKEADERNYVIDPLPEAESPEDTSVEEGGSDSDGSLDNFLARLYSKNVSQQTAPSKHKLSSATQTQFPNVRTSFTKKVLRVSKDFGAAEVVAVVAPTHVTSQSQQTQQSANRHRQVEPAVNSYAFIDTPPVRVTLEKRPASSGSNRPGSAPARRNPGPAVKQRTTAALTGDRPSTSGAAAGKGKVERGKDSSVPPLHVRGARSPRRPVYIATKPAWF